MSRTHMYTQKSEKNNFTHWLSLKKKKGSLNKSQNKQKNMNAFLWLCALN